MKTQHFFYRLAILMMGVILFSACRKPEEKDYRDKWVGNWDFTTIEYERWWTGHDDNGEIFTITEDTIHYIGTIETYKTNRLKIVFKPDAIEPIYPVPNVSNANINGLIYPTIDQSGNLTYPELGGVWYIGHCFLSNDSIVIMYGQNFGHLGDYSHSVQGTKINKK